MTDGTETSAGPLETLIRTLLPFTTVFPVGGSCAVTVPATLLAIMGHDWMHKTFKWSLYLSLPLYGLVTVAVTPSTPLSFFSIREAQEAQVMPPIDNSIRCGAAIDCSPYSCA